MLFVGTNCGEVGAEERKAGLQRHSGHAFIFLLGVLNLTLGLGLYTESIVINVVIRDDGISHFPIRKTK